MVERFACGQGWNLLATILAPPAKGNGVSALRNDVHDPTAAPLSVKQRHGANIDFSRGSRPARGVHAETAARRNLLPSPGVLEGDQAQARVAIYLAVAPLKPGLSPSAFDGRWKGERSVKHRGRRVARIWPPRRPFRLTGNALRATPGSTPAGAAKADTGRMRLNYQYPGGPVQMIEVGQAGVTNSATDPVRYYLLSVSATIGSAVFDDADRFALSCKRSPERLSHAATERTPAGPSDGTGSARDAIQ
jgi:hypothetical protein